MAITFKTNQVFGCICLACTRKAQLFGTCWKRLALRSLVGLSLVGMVSSVWFLLCYRETIIGNCFLLFFYSFIYNTNTYTTYVTYITNNTSNTYTYNTNTKYFVCLRKEREGKPSLHMSI